METQSINPEIPLAPRGTSLDISDLEGSRAEIESWSIIDVNSKFGDGVSEVEGVIIPRGDPIPNNKTIKAKSLKISTKLLKDFTLDDGRKVEIRGSTLFGLIRMNNGEYGLPSSSTAKFNKFLKKMKVNTLSELKGKFVTITIDENNYAKIVTG